MASQGATLQNYNNQLVQYIEELKEKREELNNYIMNQEEERQNIQKQMLILQDAYKKIENSLQQKQNIRNDYDKVIQDTEGAYIKKVVKHFCMFQREKILPCLRDILIMEKKSNIFNYYVDKKQKSIAQNTIYNSYFKVGTLS